MSLLLAFAVIILLQCHTIKHCHKLLMHVCYQTFSIISICFKWTISDPLVVVDRCYNCSLLLSYQCSKHVNRLNNSTGKPVPWATFWPSKNKLDETQKTKNILVYFMHFNLIDKYNAIMSGMFLFRSFDFSSNVDTIRTHSRTWIFFSFFLKFLWNLNTTIFYLTGSLNLLQSIFPCDSVSTRLRYQFWSSVLWKLSLSLLDVLSWLRL